MMNQTENIFNLFERSVGVSIDTRTIEKGQLFFAIKGDNFDGNKYAANALNSGAIAAVVDDKCYAGMDAYVVVDNVLESLQQLAKDYRDRLDIPVIGITGSNGKTTTKELLYSVLCVDYKIHATRGNFNNHIGVPLTILSMPSDTEILIVEMGASFAGEIEELCQIAKPNMGLITNISSAHLEGFGDVQTIIATKTALYRYLAKDGLVFVNKGDDQLLALLNEDQKIVKYDPSSDLLFDSATPLVSWIFSNKGKEYHLRTNLVGKYNKPNISVAIQVGLYMNIDITEILLAISSYQPSNNRSQLKKVGTNDYILDAYNANPISVKNSIESLASVDAEKKVLILGDMLELGSIEARSHQEIVDLIGLYKWDAVYLVGSRYSQTQNQKKMLVFDNTASLKKYLSNNPLENALVLLKGSRGIALEKLLV